MSGALFGALAPEREAELLQRIAQLEAEVARLRGNGDTDCVHHGHSGQSYAATSTDGGRDYAHRAAYRQHHGEIPDGMVVDHICRNRWCVNPAHLRLATRSENAQNSGSRGRGTSPYKGVSLVRVTGKWQAHIKINGNGSSRYLGVYVTQEEAARAYDRAALAAWGEFAFLNFPDEVAA